MSTVKHVLLLKHQHVESISSKASHLSMSSNTVRSYLAKVKASKPIMMLHHKQHIDLNEIILDRF